LFSISVPSNKHCCSVVERNYKSKRDCCVFTGLQGSPSGGPSVVAQKVLALVRQTYGRDVRHVLHRPVQPEHGDVEPVGLRRELEERMDADLAHAERVRGQRFHRGVDHVVAERHLHLARRRSADAKDETAVTKFTSRVGKSSRRFRLDR